MKNIFHAKFPNVTSKLRSSDADSLSLPPYAESLYQSSKIDKDIYYELYKMMSSLCVQNYTVSDDKKTKKTTWESMSSWFSELEKKLSEDSLTKGIMTSSIKAFDEMARNTKEFERTLSLNVIKHFHDLSDDNTLGSTKKALTTLNKDIKSNADKVQLLQNQLNNQPSDALSFRKTAEVNNSASIENKLISAQATEESTVKECGIKQDIYLSKLFAAEFQKIKTTEKILEFFQDYIQYYAKCQRTLQKFIPEFQKSLENHKNIYSFHVPLEDHLSYTNRKLSYVLETCITQLDNEETLQHEGIFRISGSKIKVDLLKNALNVMRVDEFITKTCNSAVYTGVLKQYLRELPNPLMTFELYDQWFEVGTKIRQNDTDGTMTLIRECLTKLPVPYYDNLVYLMQLLKKIACYESVNKMSSSNLGLMLGPNLIRNKQTFDSEDSETSAYSMLGSPGGTVIDFMISHFNELFPNSPVYITAPKVLVTVPDNTINENEPKKDENKKLKVNIDNDSISVVESKFGDGAITPGVNPSDNVHSDYFQRDESNVRQRSFRKQQAPLPPQIRPFIVNNEPEKSKEFINMRPLNRPTVTKRMSKLEKSVTDPSKNPDEIDIDTQNYPTVSTLIQSITFPNKKENVTAQSDLADKRTIPHNPPLKRPNIPPPPIPSFDKLKENLKTKEQPEYVRKQSFQDETLLTSFCDDLSSQTSSKHQYSNSDVTNTSF